VPSQAGAGICANDSDAGLPLTVPATGAAQLALPQETPIAVNWQPPPPLHLPVLPHGGAATQVVSSRGEPLLAMLLQVPTLDARVQLWHAPLHTELQQTPSGLQTLLVQSEFTLQA
jgi:hypothetical protein